jgi:hypothetical protein
MLYCSFSLAFLTGQIVWWIPFVVIVAGAFGAHLYLLPQFRIFAAWNMAGDIAFIPLAMCVSAATASASPGFRLRGTLPIR